MWLMLTPGGVGEALNTLNSRTLFKNHHWHPKPLETHVSAFGHYLFLAALKSHELKTETGSTLPSVLPQHIFVFMQPLTERKHGCADLSS